jgi:hypothetical protein
MAESAPRLSVMRLRVFVGIAGCCALMASRRGVANRHNEISSRFHLIKLEERRLIVLAASSPRLPSLARARALARGRLRHMWARSETSGVICGVTPPFGPLPVARSAVQRGEQFPARPGKHDRDAPLQRRSSPPSICSRLLLSLVIAETVILIDLTHGFALNFTKCASADLHPKADLLCTLRVLAVMTQRRHQ